jgi:hypothetical protein
MRREIFLVLLAVSMTFVYCEFYLHAKVIGLMWGQIQGYQVALQEKEEELGAKKIEFAELGKEKNKWIFETIRLRNRLARYEHELKIEKEAKL